MAAIKNGISALSSMAGNVIGKLGDKFEPFYVDLGLGLGLGAGVTAATRKRMQFKAARQNRQALQTVFKLQNAAALARQGFERSRTDLLRQARQATIATIKEDIEAIKDKNWQSNIIRFAADIAEATDPEQITRPGNMAWVEQSKQTLNAGRLIFVTKKSPGWSTPLAAGSAVVASTLLTTGLRRKTSRRRQIKDEPRRSDTLYIDSLQKFYEQKEFVETFNFEQGQGLTRRTKGRPYTLSDLKKSVGGSATIEPLTKQSGEDDIFLINGPRGHIHYRNSGAGAAVVLAAIPRYGQEARFSKALKS